MQPATAQSEGRERFVYVAGSVPGRIWIAVFACAVLVPALGFLAPAFALAIAIASFRREWRRSVLSSLALAVCVVNFLPGTTASNGVSLGLALLGAGWIIGLLVWTRWPQGRNPILYLHGIAVAGLAVICLSQKRTSLSAMTAGALCALIPELLWRSSYWIKWRQRKREHTAVWSNLFTTLPFLGAGGVPFGKGPLFLATHEAADAGQLAVAQLEGVRLLALALMWRVADAVLQSILWGMRTNWLPSWMPFAKPLLPNMEALMRIPASYPLWQRWGGVYAELFHNIIGLASFGHTLVGIYCLVGFHIPRNTQAPLLATTIVDFWGRYYFYFKELLMDFFFFPAFLRTSRLPVLWRTLLATGAAAFLGNLYYHVVLYAPVLGSGDTRGYLSLVSARVIYCALLAAGLSISFARSLRRRPAPGPISIVRRTAQAITVATFFALLHVWNYGGAPIPLERRMHLWKTLGGMDTRVQGISTQR